MSEIDFEAEGLLDGVDGEAREARLTLLRDLAEAGVPLEELRQAVAEDRLLLVPVERVFEPEGTQYSVREVADELDLSVEFVQSLRQSLGLPRVDPDAPTGTQAELEAARRAKTFMDAGIPEEGLLEISRIIGMGMSQLATANRDLIGDRFIEAGVNERELAFRYAAAAQTMIPLLGETLTYAHNVHLREAIRQAVVSDQELAAGRLDYSDEVTVAFADLVGFTGLGERLEIEAIGDLTERLFRLSTDVVKPSVRLVKMIGDAAMFASNEAVPLVESVVELVESANTEELPSLRAGIATGQALGRGGDWYGRPVNLASRITGFAAPDSVVASDEVKSAVGEEAGFSFSFAGNRRFKGIKGEVPVHRIRRAEQAERS